MRLAVLLFPGLCTAAFAAQPVLLESTTPQVSAEARTARLAGEVLLSLVVGEDGHAHEVRVLKPLGLGLDEGALAAVREWRFSSAAREETPVETTVRVNFPVRSDPLAWRMDAANFDVPAGVVRPVLIEAPYPRSAAKSAGARVSLFLKIDGKGVPVNIQVRNASDPSSADEVIALIREWRFQAAMRNGIPFEVDGYLDFVTGEAPPLENGIVGDRPRPRRRAN